MGETEASSSTGTRLLVLVLEEVVRHLHGTDKDDDKSKDKESGDHLLELADETVDDEHGAKHLEVGQRETHQ